MERKELVDKFENMGFLTNIIEEDKLPLSILLEYSLIFLINKEENGELTHKIGVYFIPIIIRLFSRSGYIDYENIFNNYSIWYNIYGNELVCDNCDEDMVIISEFLKYFTNKEGLKDI